MLPVTFTIWARCEDGSQIECFAWCRDAASGINRAWKEGLEFGFKLIDVWAVPV